MIHCNHFFQSSKVLVKKELAYVPVIGWMWYFLEIVFCKRKWEEDRITVSQSLQKLRDYPENFWVRHQSAEPSIFIMALKSECKVRLYRGRVRGTLVFSWIVSERSTLF